MPVNIKSHHPARTIFVDPFSHVVLVSVCLKVIDLISLKPFDMETISNSVKKTRRVLIVEECMKTGGIGASLSAVISESLFDDLDHQVMRLSSQDVPTAYAFELEASTIVQPEQVIATVEQMVGVGSEVELV